MSKLRLRISMSFDGYTSGPDQSVKERHMFGGHPGGWDAKAPWRGWWGENPPFHHPVFVLTHHEREPVVMKGNTTA